MTHKKLKQILSTLYLLPKVKSTRRTKKAAELMGMYY